MRVRYSVLIVAMLALHSPAVIGDVPVRGRNDRSFILSKSSAKSDRAMDMKDAIGIAIDSVRNNSRRWDAGCEIRARLRGNEWVIYLAPVPTGPGLDVVVTVQSDGTATVGPLY
jgi:hypothetical protein